jgi:hypothetical protein
MIKYQSGLLKILLIALSLVSMTVASVDSAHVGKFNLTFEIKDPHRVDMIDNNQTQVKTLDGNAVIYIDDRIAYPEGYYYMDDLGGKGAICVNDEGGFLINIGPTTDKTDYWIYSTMNLSDTLTFIESIKSV